MGLDFKKKPRNRRSHLYVKIALAVVLVGALVFLPKAAVMLIQELNPVGSVSSTVKQ